MNRQSNNQIEDMRAKVSQVMMLCLWLNAALAGVTGALAHNGWLAPLLLGLAIAGAAHASWMLAPRGKSSRLTITVAFIALVSVLVAAARGTHMQIDLHMYYFAALAILAAYCDRDVILLGTGVVALHHLLLNFAAPALVFPDGSDLPRVLLHAVVVVVEAGALVWMASSVVRMFQVSQTNLNAAEQATQRAEQAQREADAQHEARAADQALIAQAQAQSAAQLEAVVSTLAGAHAALAKGGLGQTLQQDFPPEYEILRRDFNEAVAQLRHMVRGLLENAASVTHGAAEITSAVKDLSTRTERQAATLEESTAALNEVTHALHRTAEDVIRTRTVVQAAQQITQTSSQVVQEAVTAMDGIDASSRQISQIIGVINDIAFQTNLLALNAGVEAARAGDAGRGFAVVATEVRALSQRTSDAAREIKALISASETQVRAGVDCVGRTGEVLTALAAQVGEIDQVIGAISETTRQQTAALSVVNQTISDMDQATQRNAAMAEQTSAAVQGLLQEAQQMSSLASRFTLDPAPVPPIHAASKALVLETV